jgi:hypothetical protein
MVSREGIEPSICRLRETGSNEQQTRQITQSGGWQGFPAARFFCFSRLFLFFRFSATRTAINFIL